ncbi:CehA/McbA family metallohydrolase [Deinococcus ruber]|uniref:Phosphoesterase n=1 Tax=Deinococcus ruber TaxID=1848197 RepID=A0A918F8C0_9DEIO|nr:CehA/McbA family metallohydrolase [Deinococcus ruber]GGR10725.1 phosphoesterase [Deinococcus ruber]
MTDLLIETVTLSLEDSKRHLPFTFFCPEGTGELHLHWEFEPAGAGELRTLITLSVEGPHGFRGAGHRHGTRQTVVLGEGAVTPGYLPGPISSGEWTVTLHTHLVMGHTSGKLRVTGHAAPHHPEQPRPADLLPAPPPTRTWMKGDLHCHTVHSDGCWTAEQLAAAALQQALSFLALTDHNTLSGRAELAAAFPGLLLPGTELTTYYGHALVLGQQAFPGWTQLEPQRGMADLAQRVSLEGGYVVIAHPFAAGDPICTGCAWTYFDLRPENTSHMEVWNGPWHGRHNSRALAYWYTLLAAGKRVVATAGSDAHGPAYLPGTGFTCTPATSDPAFLLRQLREGQTYLSAGPELHLTVLAPDQTAVLGGSVAAGTWHLRLSWEGVPEGSVLVWVVDGREHREGIQTAGTQDAAFDVNTWLNLEIRAAGGELLALTNPVYARR